MHASRFRFVACALSVSLLSTVAFAHDGHGAVAAERVLPHWLFEPQHALTVLGAALLVALATRRRIRVEAAGREGATKRPR